MSLHRAHSFYYCSRWAFWIWTNLWWHQSTSIESYWVVSHIIYHVFIFKFFTIKIMNSHIYVCIYTYTYVCVCVCVCVIYSGLKWQGWDLNTGCPFTNLCSCLPCYIFKDPWGHQEFPPACSAFLVSMFIFKTNENI
jgi:hypothetical protein